MKVARVIIPKRAISAPPASGDALSHGLAMIAAPVSLGFLGAWLDSLLGTGPALLLALAAFGVAASFASAYYRYEQRIARHEEGKPWTRRARAEAQG